MADEFELIRRYLAPLAAGNPAALDLTDDAAILEPPPGVLTEPEIHTRLVEALGRLPMDVVEALIGDDPNELDLEAGLDALAAYDGEDLVAVESDDGESVRVWIDTTESR